ncbi:T9SS type A sorting domain-containing protein [Flavivirga sp. 57AJ16]|uniref:T9SS type A sorting domain-containing protein n=1 Tax=Flavivirga sp. 57AJ16 TaxID=3025307 RepID=UPI0023665ADA|nr:T9SS type A sorting domain-containing protein [Flavivirga sp. 57AJ16]MDD7885081.1 T9SS type A sorting domain-containing protein [Flavivirga sp. 57AJ16]
MKTKLLVLALALTVQFVNAQFNFKVFNKDGNPQENVEIVFSQPGWADPVVTYYTDANGIAVIPASSGNDIYQYELYYTGTEGLRNTWGWGNADFTSSNDFEVSQNYPFYSGDNISTLTFSVGNTSTINFNVTNNDVNGDNIWCTIEVWISQTNNESDFHYTMAATEWVGNSSEVTFPFDFTPSATGNYNWKAVVHYNNPTGTPTSDSFDWTSAFNVGTLGVEDQVLNNAVKLYPNPVVDNKIKFDLKTNNFIGGEVALIDVVGRTIVSKTIEGNLGEINATGTPSGLYFVKFTKDDISATQKVIIK